MYYWKKKDCLVILPTGFGKSLPFHIFLPVIREINADFLRNCYFSVLPFNCISAGPGGDVINNHKYFGSIHRYACSIF